MLIRWLYGMLKKWVGIFFNVLNILLAGNLPPFGCVCLVIEKEGQYLIIDDRGGYAFPGGFMRWREHPIQTAQREGMEETGLQLEIHELIDCFSSISHNFSHMSTLILIYRAEIIGGELRGSVEGQPCWKDEAELREKLNPQQLGILNAYSAYYEKKDVTK